MSEISTRHTIVRVDDVGTRTSISPDLCGIFFEDINSGFDGIPVRAGETYDFSIDRSGDSLADASLTDSACRTFAAGAVG
ncbi:hypothetical protein [Rathayibacter soli]|uniref:hypothetical protein n=1 Tax=Rathayibacter soli TaxID=3144168 RepID=UPI0027E54F82|nr:hypothetical protein [Glaciibacter superstes]